MRILMLVALVALAGCSDSTAPCTTIAKPVMLGRLIQLDGQGCITHIDTLYSDMKVLADTFRVCGSDTIRVSGVERKFTTNLPTCD